MAGKNKKYLIISFSIILLLGAVGGIIYFISKRIKTAPQAVKNEPVKPQIFGGNKEEQDKIYHDYKTLENAAKQRNPKLCEELIYQQNINGCYYSTAVSIAAKPGSSTTTAAGLEACTRVTDQTMKGQCEQLFAYFPAVKTAQPESCLKITDKNFKDACLKQLLNDKKKISDCENFSGEVRAMCADLVYGKIAYQESKSDICDKIVNNDLKVNCAAIVGNKPGDADRDGLNDEYERMIGTNPWKTDTDGDGCPDGDELKSGHNPLLKNDGAGDNATCLKNPIKRK